MNTEINGLPELFKALEQRKERISDALKGVLSATALEIEAEAIKSIQRGSKTGREYRRGGVLHRASSPGESPATDTGELANSIRSVIKTDSAWVGTDKEYGAWLEYGTQSMAERPWLRPAKAKAQGKFRKDMMDAVRKAAK